MKEFIAEPHPRANRHLIGRIKPVQGDLTRQVDVDAIVAAIPVNLDVSGSLNTALIAAAGQRMDDFMLEHVFKPRPGDIVAVPAFNLPVRHILYAVTPDWRDGFNREDRDLIRCYRGAMETAKQMGLARIAFAALGTGSRKFPVRRAARLGLIGILDRLDESFEEVRIVCNKPETLKAFREWIDHFSAQES